MELGECYVCTDACDTLSPCKCKNLFLHENCYAMLLLYDNKNCGVCLENYPLVDIKPITTIVQEEEEEEIEPNPLWIFCPIMMRPYSFKLKAIYMGLDVLVDIIRNMVLLFLWANIISLLTASNLNNAAVWVYGFCLHVAVCMFVRHGFASK